MANEPNNAEEQLKQYAAERRRQAPQEIHPATRNVLQGEVRRTYGGPEEERRGRMRLRWMQAFAGLAIAAAIPFFFLPRGPKENLKEALPTPASEVDLQLERKWGEAPIVLSDTKEPVAPVVMEAPAASAQRAAPAPITTREQAQTELRTRAVQLQAERSRAVAKDEAGVAPVVSNLSFANNVSNQPILNRFNLEQTGARVKIMEADGSVYPGRVVSQQGGNDVFHAAGVSRSLNRAVVLTGQVVRASLSVAQNQQQPQQPATQQSQVNTVQNNASNNSLLNNSEDVRVQGQATVGNLQYKVDAQVSSGP